jgi:hypothetical protein
MGQKAVGGCALPGGGGCFITWYFPPADAAQEQSGCQSISGTWMSP